MSSIKRNSGALSNNKEYKKLIKTDSDAKYFSSQKSQVNETKETEGIDLDGLLTPPPLWYLAIGLTSFVVEDLVLKWMGRLHLFSIFKRLCLYTLKAFFRKCSWLRFIRSEKRVQVGLLLSRYLETLPRSYIILLTHNSTRYGTHWMSTFYLIHF